MKRRIFGKIRNRATATTTTTTTTVERSPKDVLPWTTVYRNYTTKHKNIVPTHWDAKHDLKEQYDKSLELYSDRPLHPSVTMISDMNRSWDDLIPWLVDIYYRYGFDDVAWLSFDHLTVQPILKALVVKVEKNQTSSIQLKKRRKYDKQSICTISESIGIWSPMPGGRYNKYERKIFRDNRMPMVGTVYLFTNYPSWNAAVTDALCDIKRLSRNQNNIYINELYIKKWMISTSTSTVGTTSDNDGVWQSAYNPELEEVLAFDDNHNRVYLYNELPTVESYDRVSRMPVLASETIRPFFKFTSRQLSIKWNHNYFDMILDYSTELCPIMERMIDDDANVHVDEQDILASLVLSRLVIAHYQRHIELPLGTIHSIIRNQKPYRDSSDEYLGILIQNVLCTRQKAPKTIVQESIRLVIERYPVLNDDIFVNILAGTYMKRDIRKGCGLPKPVVMTRREAELKSKRTGGLTPLSNIKIITMPKISVKNRWVINMVLNPYKRHIRDRKQLRLLESIVNNHLIGAATQSKRDSDMITKNLTGKSVNELLEKVKVLSNSH